MKYVLLFLVLLSLASCSTPPKGDVALHRVMITADTTLQRNYTDTAFVVRNATLNLGGFTVSGRQKSGTYIDNCIILDSGGAVTNGVLSSCTNGVLVSGGVGAAQEASLKTLPESDGVALIRSLQQQANRNQRISNVTFLNSAHASIYVGPYAQNVVIKSNTMKNTGFMAIYLDRNSANGQIHGNQINACGYGHLGHGRECIAVDSSEKNMISQNQITNGKYAGVTLYKNCGEAGIPRWLGANDNQLKNNVFHDMEKGIWISSRKYDRYSSSCFRDTGDIVERTVLQGNRFSYVEQPVIDWGVDTIRR